MTTTTPTTNQSISSSEKRDWAALERKYYQHTFNRSLVMERGEGVRVYDADGHAYLDLVAGIATNVLGHAHPNIIEAVQYQVTQLVHVSNLYYNTRQIELAELLGTCSGGMRSFFSNSGAEANEGAIKLARKYGRLNRNGAYEIISMDRSFHGRTLATTAATGQKKYQDTWRPLPDGFKQVPFADFDALKAAVSNKTIGILIEAVQGEGGIYPASTEYMQQVRAFCDEQNLILICDEVQAGMGRTGKFFSYENMGIKPDITTMAKGLAGGVPIGAMLANDRLDIFEPGDHGTTFGGNPIACAAGIATIKTILEQNLLENATKMGEYWNSQLEALCSKYNFIDSPRGLGLMRAVHVKHDLAPVIVQKALEHGLLLNSTSANTLRMIPPLILTATDIDEAAELLDRALKDVAQLPAAQE